MTILDSWRPGGDGVEFVDRDQTSTVIAQGSITMSQLSVIDDARTIGGLRLVIQLRSGATLTFENGNRDDDEPLLVECLHDWIRSWLAPQRHDHFALQDLSR